MRFIFVLLVAIILFTECPELQVKTHNVSHITIVDDTSEDMKSYDVTCVSDAEYKSSGEGKGFVTDNKCETFITTPKGTYKCSLAFGTDGKPITENTTISESCEIEIEKKTE